MNAVRRILSHGIPISESMNVLDVGCGDGFVITEMFRKIPVHSITGIDIELSPDEIVKFSSENRRIRYLNMYKDLKNSFYDLILMLDVIEHIEDDGKFLRNIVNTYLRDDGYIVITAPAFQGIFGAHDRFLRHYRRYSRTELVKVITESGLMPMHSGFLFVSLLPIRILGVLWEKFFFRREGKIKGVGKWSHGKVPTKILELMLSLENLLSIHLNRLGIRFPGLTVWALCRKQR